MYGAHEKKISLTDDPLYNPDDIPGIPNQWVVDMPVIPPQESTGPVVWGSVQLNQITRYGFIEIQDAILIHETGDILPLGKYETLCAIRHRNKILRDSGINLPVPVGTAEETETDCFKRLLYAANTTPGNGYLYYFPIFSLAYAYQPAVKNEEKLSPKFLAHNWFVPAPGDLGIIAWHWKQTEGIDAIFAKAKNAIGMNISDSSMYAYLCSTGEDGESNCARIDISTGKTASSAYGATGKWFSSQVYPMVQF